METEILGQETGAKELPVTGGEDAPRAGLPEGGATPPAADAGQSGDPARGEKPSWEQILADPQYKSRFDAAVQGIVKGRLRDRRQAEERLEKLGPVLRALEEDFGLTEDADMGALAARLRGSAGLSRPDGGEIAAHLAALFAEAESLRESVPDFDLLRELEDPAFLRMTAPRSGVSLADAYYARHRAERERETARRSLEAVSRSIRSLGARPRELRDTEAGASTRTDPRQMSRQEREALKKRIFEAKARGRRITVGEE